MMDLHLPPSAPQPRRSAFGRLWRATKMVARGPINAAAPGEIIRGAGLIRSLVELLQRQPGSESRFRLDEHGGIDLQATSFHNGVSPAALDDLMGERRRQTARVAYVLFMLGTISFVGWTWETVQMKMSAARMLSAVEFLPFCALFFLLSFKSAWTNWQIRTQRLGSALEYLKTNGPFLPS